MKPEELEAQKLDRKRKILKRWTIAIGVIAAIAMVNVGILLVDHYIKAGPDGQLEINWKKVDATITFLGAEIRDIDNAIKEALGLSSTDGVLVNSVESNSPAAKGGLARGDVILTVDNTSVLNSLQFQEIIRGKKPGAKVKLIVDTGKGGKNILYVELGSKSASGQADDTTSAIKKVAGSTSTSTALQKVAGKPTTSTTSTTPTASTNWGIAVAPLTVELRTLYKIPATENGIVIVEVVQNSPAASQGLKVGYVIEKVNSTPITNLETFYSALAKDPDGVMLDVYSPFDGKRFFVSLPSEGDTPPPVVLMSMTSTVSINRVAVPVDREDINGPVYYRFAQAPYFALYDYKQKEVKYIKNPYAAQVRGTGVTVANFLIAEKIDAVIVGGIGPQSFDTFYLAKVKIYGPETGIAWTAIQNCLIGKLPELKEANIAGYGSSSTAVLPTKGSSSAVVSTKGSTTLTAGGDPRLNRAEYCVCTRCGALVTHPSGVSCSDMVCPICGARLMNADPGNDESGPTDLTTQIPVEGVTTPLVKTAGSSAIFVSQAPTTSPSTLQKTAGSNLWAISSKPETLPPMNPGQAIATPSTSTVATASTTTQVTTCVCPLDGTTVIHPVGVPCASIQCPVCGSRLVSGSVVLTAGSPMTATAGSPMMSTAGSPMMSTAGSPMMSTAGSPMMSTAGSPMMSTAGSPMMSTAGSPMMSTAGSPMTATAGGPTDGGPNTGGPTSGGPAIDGPSQGGGQSSSSSAAQSGRSTECVCPMDGTIVIHPIGVPCASLNCPLCGSRLVNATPTGSSTGSTSAIVSTAGGPTAGGPNTGGPTSGGPAVDGSTLGGSSGTSTQSGRSDECVCPMDGTAVIHPIGIPCAALNCPVCGSRLVNATPTGSTSTVAAPIVQVAGNTRKIVVPSTGKTLTSALAPMLDNAPYFLMFGLGTYEVVKNPYVKDSRATGAEVAQFIVGEGGSVVICNNVSMTALKTFKDLQVKVYTGFTGTVQQAVDIYSDGRLKNSDSISGVVVNSTDATSEEEKKGPPTSKSKSKEKEDTTIL